MATLADFDVLAREAHVVGDGPRIEPLGLQEIDDAARNLVDAVRASAGAASTNEPPEYMRTVLRHPEIFRCQMEMGTALFRGRIPARERELAVLRVAWLCQAPYEWGQHVAIAYRVGLTADEIERARLGAESGGWTEHERAILTGVDELLRDKALSDETWDVLAASWDDAQLIEFPMMVGQYVATAYVQNTLRIRLEHGNTGLRRR